MHGYSENRDAHLKRLRRVEGGDVAAPLFNKIASYELQHAKIPPTGSLSKHVPLQVCDAVTREDSPSTVC